LEELQRGFDLPIRHFFLSRHFIKSNFGISRRRRFHVLDYLDIAISYNVFVETSPSKKKTLLGELPKLFSFKIFQILDSAVHKTRLEGLLLRSGFVWTTCRCRRPETLLRSERRRRQTISTNSCSRDSISAQVSLIILIYLNSKSVLRIFDFIST
jgi:hypothetical protein